MTQRIQTKVIRTLPVVEFSPEVQRAVAAVGQHIDFLLSNTQALFIHKGHTGSDSWTLGNETDNKVILKTFPWNQSFRKDLDLPPSSTKGFGVLVRDEFLTPSDMRCLWNVFGKAYRPSPSFPLYAVRPQDKVHFQLLLWKLGDGCDVFALPGVLEEEIERRLPLRSFDGRIHTSHADHDTSATSTDGSNEADPAIIAALKAMVLRAQADVQQ